MQNKINVQTSLENMNQALWYTYWTFDLFKHYVQGSILEIGCGIGNFSQILADYGEVSAIDIEATYLKETRKKLLKKVRVGFGDIEKGNYFFGKKRFDSVVCLNVLEHILDHESALKNIYDLVKPGKYLILLVPSHPLLYGSIDRAVGHYRRYIKNNLITLVEKNKFSIVYVRRINLLGALGWWFSGKILRDTAVNKTKFKIFDIVARFILPIEKLVEPPFGISILLIAKKQSR